MTLRKFESGVLVLQLADHNDQVFGRKIVGFLEQHGGKSILEIAQAFNVSVVLATEQLKVFLSSLLSLFLCRGFADLFADRVVVVVVSSRPRRQS